MTTKYPGGFITKSPVAPTTSAASGMWTMEQATQYIQAGTWPIAVPPVVPDPYFPYNTLLLPGNGTNGAQNNTFLDTDAAPITINMNGSVTQGSVSPYGSLWSNYFDGDGDYLSAPSNAALAFGTGDFTVECWVYVAQSSNTYRRLFWFEQNNSTSGSGLAVEVYNTPGTSFTLNTGAGQIGGSTASGQQWNHIAATRASGTTRFFVNGSLVGSVSDTSNYTASTGPLIGAGYYNGSIGSLWLQGFLSNFRAVKGTALYTSNFTPSTTPLTAVSGTVLLTCQSNRFVDNSTNNFTLTRNGNVAVYPFAPFSPTSSYSAATNGASGYFDGDGDYLKSDSSSGFAFGSNDFTMEAWVYMSSTTGVQGVVSTRVNASGNTDQVFFGIESGAVLYYSGGTAAFSGGSVVPSSWNHIACSRQGGTVRVFLNGALVTSGTDNASKTTTFGYIGAGGGDNSQLLLGGYICDARFVNGTAVYTAPFTPPTAPLTAVTNTVLLCNFANAGVVDAAAENDIYTFGDAQITTSVSKFGGSSMQFGGTTGYLTAPPNVNFVFGADNFTVEMWVRPNSIAGGTTVFDTRSGANTNGVSIWFTVGSIGFDYPGGFAQNTSYSISTSTFTHLALVRNGGTLTLYANGTSVVSASVSFSATAGNLQVGRKYTPGEYLNGYIDDLRVTKGYARYTANFTPPTAAFPTL